MKKITLFLVLSIYSFASFAQEEVKEEKKFSAKFYGFVKSDFFWDSRQTFSPREGHFLLWPSAVSEDANGDDINANPNFNFLSIQSRIGVSLTGPSVLNAKTSAKIEGDFFAQATDNINLLRLRHAIVKLNWENTELLFGQYWIPMFVTGCFPGTVSFNTGAPIQPFGRNPQIRVTHKLGDVKLIGILSSQRDYVNRGPAGATGSYLRNSGIPAADVQIHFNKNNKEAGTALLFGAGGGIKKLVPRLSTTGTSGVPNSTDEGVTSFSTIGFFKLKVPSLTFKLEGVYGQNIDDALSIGGFAVSEVVNDVTGERKYTPSNTLSVWTDIHSNGKTQFGLFAGYTQNQGFSKDIDPTVEFYGLGNNIESLFRVSPRVIFNFDHIRFAIEGEYTSANFGTVSEIDKGVPQNTTAANNFRALFAVYYFFK